jgi:hypothetical protein
MPQTTHAPTIIRRLLAGAVACALALPASAGAQGAGDDQYRDPFPETTAQGAQADDVPTETTGEGLSETPPTSDSTGSSSGSSTGSSNSTGSTETTTDEPADTEVPSLARTGDDPWIVALVGASLLLLGAGLRLRGGAQRGH